MRGRRARQPTAIFLPGESQGQGSPAGYRSQGGKESVVTERVHTQRDVPVPGDRRSLFNSEETGGLARWYGGWEPLCQCRALGLHPCMGRSHTPPSAPAPLCCCGYCPLVCRACRLRGQKLLPRETRAEQPRATLAPHLQKAQAQQRQPRASKNKYVLFFIYLFFPRISIFYFILFSFIFISWKLITI